MRRSSWRRSRITGGVMEGRCRGRMLRMSMRMGRGLRIMRMTSMKRAINRRKMTTMNSEKKAGEERRLI